MANTGLLYDPTFRMIVALLSGMLIGIEREKARAALARRKHRKPGVEELVAKEFPGIRTFSLVSIYAAVLGYLWSAGLIDAVMATVFLLVFGAVVVVFAAYRLMVARLAGITTVVVLLLDFILGFLSGVGEVLLAASAAVLTTFMLAIKLPAERIVGRIRYEELLWALELLVVIIVVGPFFIESSASFYGVSVRSLYLFFALVLTTSYLGYVMARLKGGEGLAYTAFFGGLANSEATLMAILQLLRGLGKRLAFDLTVLTNTAMILRNALIAVVAAYIGSHGVLAFDSVLPVVAASALAVLPGYYAWRRSISRLVETQMEIENPLSFGTALRTTLLYLAIAFVSDLVKESATGGLLLVSAIGGFVSSSATILAIYSVGITSPQVVAQLAVVATAAGALNKPLYAYMGSHDREAVAKSLAASLLQASLMAPGALLAAILASTR